VCVLRDAAHLDRIGVTPARLARATHLVWGTGGSMVPDSEFAAYVDKGRALQRPSS
jgi:D-serine dehydratase